MDITVKQLIIKSLKVFELKLNKDAHSDNILIVKAAGLNFYLLNKEQIKF